MVKSFHLIKAIYLVVSPKSKGEIYLHDPYSLARVDILFQLILVYSYMTEGKTRKWTRVSTSANSFLTNKHLFEKLKEGTVGEGEFHQ